MLLFVPTLDQVQNCDSQLNLLMVNARLEEVWVGQQCSPDEVVAVAVVANAIDVAAVVVAVAAVVAVAVVEFDVAVVDDNSSYTNHVAMGPSNYSRMLSLVALVETC